MSPVVSRRTTKAILPKVRTIMTRPATEKTVGSSSTTSVAASPKRSLIAPASCSTLRPLPQGCTPRARSFSAFSSRTTRWASKEEDPMGVLSSAIYLSSRSRFIEEIRRERAVETA